MPSWPCGLQEVMILTLTIIDDFRVDWVDCKAAVGPGATWPSSVECALGSTGRRPRTHLAAPPRLPAAGGEERLENCCEHLRNAGRLAVSELNKG